MANDVPASLEVGLSAFEVLVDQREDLQVVDFAAVDGGWVRATLQDGEELLFAAACDLPSFAAVAAFEVVASMLNAWAQPPPEAMH